MEAELLIQRLAPAKPRTAAMERWPLYEGALGGQEVALLLTGMGMVNSAAALAACLEHMPEARALVNLGCAGAYAGSGLRTGQAALADEIVLADHGVRTSRKLHGLEKTGIPLLRHGEDEIYNRLPCHGELSERLALPEMPQGLFACVAQVSGDPATAAMVEERWGAILEDMESGAAAQVAALYGLPFACVRGVSNLAGARDLDVKAGAEAAQNALFKALEEKP
jgi:futalosine hydrolase